MKKTPKAVLPQIAVRRSLRHPPLIIWTAEKSQSLIPLEPIQHPPNPQGNPVALTADIPWKTVFARFLLPKNGTLRKPLKMNSHISSMESTAFTAANWFPSAKIDARQKFRDTVHSAEKFTANVNARARIKLTVVN